MLLFKFFLDSAITDAFFLVMYYDFNPTENLWICYSFSHPVNIYCVSTMCFFLRICEQGRQTHSFLLLGKINTEQVITSVMNVTRKSRGPLAPVWGEVGDQRKLPTTETQLTLRAQLKTSPWSCRLPCTAPMWNSSLGASRSTHSKYDFISLCPLCPLVLFVSVSV